MDNQNSNSNQISLDAQYHKELLKKWDVDFSEWEDKILTSLTDVCVRIICAIVEKFPQLTVPQFHFSYDKYGRNVKIYLIEKEVNSYDDVRDCLKDPEFVNLLSHYSYGMYF